MRPLRHHAEGEVESKIDVENEPTAEDDAFPPRFGREWGAVEIETGRWSHRT